MPSSYSLGKYFEDFIKKEVESGRYASASEVLRSSLRRLMAQDPELENWLHGPVARAYDAHLANPAGAKPAAQVFASLRTNGTLPK